MDMEEHKDDGTITVLLQRFTEHRLPRAQAIKDKVDQGEKLSSNDMQFLKEVFETAHQVQPLIEKHPEYKEMIAKAIHLYKEIMDKALENEQSS